MSVVERHGDGLIAAKKDTTCIAIWRDKPQQESFRVQKVVLGETVAAHPGAAKFLCVVEEGAPAPDNDIRRASAEMLDGHGSRLSKVACVIEGDGFRAAITRTVLAGMGLIVKNRVPTKFFGTVDEAAAWLMASEGRLAALGLEKHVRDLRK